MTSNNHVEEIFELPGDPVEISPYSSSAAIGKNGIDLKGITKHSPFQEH